MALAAIGLLSVAHLAGPPAASAKRGLITGIADRYQREAEQPALFDLTTRASPDMVRIGVDWRNTAKSRPANPRDPSDPAYDFSGLDSAILEAEARGLGVVFTVVNTPDWAEGPNPPANADPGSWDPDPEAFGAFGHALATRYSGSFAERGGAAPLPRVRHFEVWNEANTPAGPARFEPARITTS